MEDYTIHLGYALAQGHNGIVGEAQHTGLGYGLLASPCQLAGPALARRVATTCGRGHSAHGSAGGDGSTLAKIWEQARENELQASANTPLHENLREKAGKGCSPERRSTRWKKTEPAGDFTAVGEGAPKSVPELHKGT
jgi:hypothetical protein